MDTKPIKILHLLESNHFSGAENVVCQIIDLFKNENVEMIYCSPSGQIQESLKERNITYQELKNLSISEIRKVVKLINPDYIHAHDARMAVLASLAGFSGRLIAHIHGNHPNMRTMTVKSLSVAFCSLFWKKIIWVSDSSFEGYRFRKLVTNNSIVLPNIIRKKDVENSLMQAYGCDKEYDCIVLGRVNAIKDPFRAIKIFTKVSLSYPHFRAVFVGSGEMLEECKDYISKEKLDEFIEFKGFVNNPIGILNKSKMLVMTSVYEGTPMCAVEAMALGKPIVSTPTDGIVDLVDQDMTGYYSDNDDLLAQKIISILSDTQTYEQMVQSTLTRFDLLMDESEYIDKLSNIYK